jgi:hypothetical protein
MKLSHFLVAQLGRTLERGEFTRRSKLTANVRYTSDTSVCRSDVRYTLVCRDSRFIQLFSETIGSVTFILKTVEPAARHDKLKCIEHQSGIEFAHFSYSSLTKDEFDSFGKTLSCQRVLN